MEDRDGVAKNKVVEEYRALIEHQKTLVEFTADFYLERMVDCRIKIQGLFSELNLNHRDDDREGGMNGGG